MAAAPTIAARRPRRLAVVSGGEVRPERRSEETAVNAMTPESTDELARSGAAGRKGTTRMGDHPFRELDDLVLHLKGLVLVAGLRRERGADADELDMYRIEIDRARDRLARFALEGPLPQLA